jgi:hypothetical protein
MVGVVNVGFHDVAFCALDEAHRATGAWATD